MNLPGNKSLNNYRPLLVAALAILMTPALWVSTSAFDSSGQPGQEKLNNAEKLGFPEGKKVILLHCDDAGMCEEANTAVSNYFTSGDILSSAVMMPCPHAVSFIEWAKTVDSPDIGVHLTLTSEWKTYRWGTVSDPSKVPGLIDPEGKMWRNVPSVVINASPGEVETEIRAQIEKVITLGFRPTHIDTHMGTLYGSPEYLEVFLRIAEEYNIPANALDPSDTEVIDAYRKQGYPITSKVIDLLNKYPLPRLDNFTSVPDGDSYENKRENFFELINSLKPGLTEIIFHPSVETENLKSITGSWQQRVWEARMFSDPVVKKFMEDNGIIITTWNEIMKRHRH